MKTLVREGRGEFYKKEEALIFKDENGSEFLVPEDIKDEIKVKVKKAQKEDGTKAQKEDDKK